MNFPSVSQNRALQEVLDRARSVGDLGPESNDSVISQSLKFVDALPAGTAEIADLGSGAGVPGIVLALALPQLKVRLVERSQKRCDGLVLAIGKLGLSDRVKVYCGEAQKVGHSLEGVLTLTQHVFIAHHQHRQLFLLCPGTHVLIPATQVLPHLESAMAF